MTFNDNAKIDSSKVSRRGRNGAIAGGGGVVGIIAIFLISQLTGFDLSQFVGGGAGGGGGDGTDDPIANCDTGKQANDSLDCRIAAAADSLDTYWNGEFSSGYYSPKTRLFTDQTSTGCGTASSATGPFYCPSDESIYIDTAFYDELRTRFGANGGPLSELYVVAHEWGHHVQHISGVTDGLDLQQTGPDSDSVHLELQADCFAGSWVGAASETKAENGVPFLEPVTKAQIADALSAASAVGDDRIQESATGSVNKEAWTHGSSAQRQKSFQNGYANGSAACTL